MGEVSIVNGAFQEVPAGAAFSPQKKARISSACVRTKAVATATTPIKGRKDRGLTYVGQRHYIAVSSFFFPFLSSESYV